MLPLISSLELSYLSYTQAYKHYLENFHLVSDVISLHYNFIIHRVSGKNKQNYFCYNYVKLLPNLIIFGTKMANCLKLYEVHSFSTSPNSCQCTTMLNADVPNSYLTL